MQKTILVIQILYSFVYRHILQYRQDIILNLVFDLPHEQLLAVFYAGILLENPQGGSININPAQKIHIFGCDAEDLVCTVPRFINTIIVVSVYNIT